MFLGWGSVGSVGGLGECGVFFILVSTLGEGAEGGGRGGGGGSICDKIVQCLGVKSCVVRVALADHSVCGTSFFFESVLCLFAEVGGWARGWVGGLVIDVPFCFFFSPCQETAHHACVYILGTRYVGFRVFSYSMNVYIYLCMGRAVLSLFSKRDCI